MPEKTAAQKKAQQKYMEKFVRVEIRMEAEKRAIIQAHAEAQSESVNGFINRAIDQVMAQDHRRSPQEGAESTEGPGVVSLPSDALEAAQRAAKAAGEAVPVFVARAVAIQAKRDELARKMESERGSF